MIIMYQYDIYLFDIVFYVRCSVHCRQKYQQDVDRKKSLRRNNVANVLRKNVNII